MLLLYRSSSAEGVEVLLSLSSDEVRRDNDTVFGSTSSSSN